LGVVDGSVLLTSVLLTSVLLTNGRAAETFPGLHLLPLVLAPPVVLDPLTIRNSLCVNGLL